MGLVRSISSICVLLWGALLFPQPEAHPVESQLGRGDVTGAQEAIDRAVKEQPRSLDLRRLQGRVWRQAGRSHELIARLRAESAANPTDPLPSTLLGDLPDSRDVRRRHYLDALQRDPDFTPARIALAELALAGQLPEVALDHLASVLAADDRHPQARILEARVLLARGEAETARDRLLALLDGRDDSGALFVLAEAHLELTEFAAARHALERGRFLSPMAPAGFRLQSRLEAQAKRPAVALETIRRGRRIAPDDLDLLNDEVRLLIDMEEWSETTALLDAHAELWAAQDPGAWACLRARLAWETRDLEALRGALAAWKPTDREVTTERILFRGRLAFLEGDTGALQAALTRLTPDEGKDLKRLRVILHHAEEKERAQRRFTFGLTGLLAVVLGVGVTLLWKRRAVDMEPS